MAIMAVTLILSHNASNHMHASNFNQYHRFIGSLGARDLAVIWVRPNNKFMQFMKTTFKF